MKETKDTKPPKKPYKLAFEFSETWGLIGNEANALDLADVVKANDSIEGIWVLLLTLTNLFQNLDGVCAPKHGQLPHCPVSTIVVSRRTVVLTVDKPNLPNIHVKKVNYR